MSKLPALTGRRLARALQNFGFEIVRKRGSHCFLKHADGRCTVVPVHHGENIGRGLLAQILRDCEIASDDLRNAL